MVTFIVLAAVALVMAVAAVAIPLMKPSATGPAPAPWAALVVTVVLVLGSAVSYAAFSNWRWNSATEPAADSPQTMVGRLARRMEQTPDDVNGWLQLGHSYVVLQEYPLGVRAFQRADRLSAGKNADALVGEAEALVLEDDSQLAGPAGQLLEQALVLAPDSGKALFYGGAAAAQRGELKLARDRFAKLLEMNPPDNVKQLLQQQVTALDQRIAGGGAAPAPGAAPMAAGNDAQGAQGVQGVQGVQGAQPGNASGPAVRVTVQLPKGAPDPSGRLFVFVRDPAAPGPPLAVKPLESHFPQTVELTPQDSPMGRGFAAGQKVQVVARVSRSGNAMAASGDPFGEVAYTVGKDGLVNITLNQVTP